MTSIAPSEIDALLKLLDDPEETVQREVRRRLSQMGQAAIPMLAAAAVDLDEGERASLESVISELRRGGLFQEWKANLDAPTPDLERGAFILARYRYPQIDLGEYASILDGFAERARPVVNEANGHARAHALSRYLCDVLGFEANSVDYYHPDNSFINKVIDDRQGIPISLSLVLLFVGRRLDLPLVGVNTPSHFLVKYVDEEVEVLIDMYHGGRTVSKRDVLRFLVKSGVSPVPEHFGAAEPADILLRMVRNLVAVALRDDRHGDLLGLDAWLRAGSEGD